MRIVRNINQEWKFSKDDLNFENVSKGSFENVNLPHTWNALDGQNGGTPYYRGKCWYTKKLKFQEDEKTKEIFVEFKGANHVSEVWINGQYLGEHKGGFSTFRYSITEHLKFDDSDELVVSVDNGKSEVYPQNADFTFSGGLYRDVNIVAVNKEHISLDILGSKGVFVTPKVVGDNSDVRVDVFATKSSKTKIVARILDFDNNIIDESSSLDEHGVLNLKIENVIKWFAVDNPYLYTCEVELVDSENNVLDSVAVDFGVREFSVDAEKGFILNGEEYNLHGVSRHQCRENMGWAITEKEHEEDIALIDEVGANTIRLAHYQHDQYFYDLCDRVGMVVWAEIPFISVYMPSEEAYENTMSQMKELVVENYNHPSICFWGISNEISIGGESEELQKNLEDLNALCKKLDPSRLTTIAHMSLLKPESKQNTITDTIAFNHYFGWYVGDVEENATWFDEYHKNMPNSPLCISEYGCEAILKWHTDNPKRKDYTEEYQAYYHEKMLEIFETRKYLWATYVWNMFDFAADNRDEGGCKGRNNKGLVTFDRRTKKDSFFIYKAYWSDEPFVHITSRRYKDRADESIDVKVYSNMEEVSLFVNDEEHSTISGDKIFVFKDVKLKDGENKIVAKSEFCYDDKVIFNKVDVANADYVYVKPENVNEDIRNWFKDLMPEHDELQFPDGYYSIRDNIGTLLSNSETANILKENVFSQMKKANSSFENPLGEEMELDVEAMKAVSLEMIWDFISKGFPNNALLIINEKLTKIKK